MSNIRPRWGYWSDGVYDPDYFQGQEVYEFAAEIDINDPKLQAELRNELQAHAVEYALDRQIEIGPRPAEIRVALEKLRPPIKALILMMDELDQGTRRSIMKGYRSSSAANGMQSPDGEPGDLNPEDLEPEDLEPGDLEPGDLEPGDLEPADLEPKDLQPENLSEFMKSLQRFETAVENAYMLLAPSKSGPTRLHALRILTFNLARVYEEQTGKKWTYDQPVDRRREHRSPSRGASWVSRVIQHIDPDVSDANLDTVLRELPSRLRESRKPPPPER
jgi:hypothetical protein